MPSVRCLVLFGSLLLTLISLTDAITLDVDCTDVAQCGGAGTRCLGGKCKCDTPWYTPCTTGVCNINPTFVYEGQECRVDANCLNNTICENQRCKCKPDFTAMNGLCYKSLNKTCTSADECWSSDCRENLCKCPLGYAPSGDNNLCRKKFAKIYSNWTYANESGDFCYGGWGTLGCLDRNAQCIRVFPNQESFCQCLPPFRADYAKQECQLIVYNAELSPSTTPLPYEECGTCKDDNALCARVDNQTTCWCRSGFFKNGENKCEKSNRYVLFPNAHDMSIHDYASPGCSVPGNNGTIESTNRLCTCAPHYTYVNKESHCQRIVPNFQNNAFEYGVCTRINSNGYSEAPTGLCPSSLSCDARQDKFVCACNGRDKYLNERNNICYHFLDRNLTMPDASACPIDSALSNSQCRCSPDNLFKTSGDYRRCELDLIDRESEASCVVGDATFNQTCIRWFGEYTRFCRQGECQCVPGKSFYQGGRCRTFLNVDTSSSDYCPINAEMSGTVCKCKVGYRDSTGQNRVCDRKVNQLYDPINAPPQGSVADVNTLDCQALYPNTPVKAHYNACVCDDGTFLYNLTCFHYLAYQFVATPGILNICPDNAQHSGQACECRAGYRNQGDNRTCARLTNTVHENNITAPNVTGIDDEGCRNLFGYAAQASSVNGHCECLNRTLAFLNGNKCYFLVETDQVTLTPGENCPPSSQPGTRICLCPHGYRATDDRRGCIRKDLYSENIQTIDTVAYSTLCVAPNNDSDCETLYGIGAVCRNATCYCDRRRSFVLGNQCQLFSKYVFPGAHERSSITCNSHEDCGPDAATNGIECAAIHGFEDNYQVCKCKAGYLLNPAESTCVRGRCSPQCRENAECDGYRCVCKDEYYQDPAGNCIKREPPLQLHERCNTTVWTGGIYNGELLCNPFCERAQCVYGYRDDGSRCVRTNFDDLCYHDRDFCERLNSNARCLKDTNRCTCLPDYYRSEGEIICAQAVNGPCTRHIDCGDFGECLNKRCRCKPGRVERQVSDSLGRTITRCINGVGPLQFSPVLVLFIAFVRMIFS